jgi:hypothetical protein
VAGGPVELVGGTGERKRCGGRAAMTDASGERRVAGFHFGLDDAVPVDCGRGLLRARTAMAVGRAWRAGLRDRAIEAWLPLVRRPARLPFLLSGRRRLLSWHVREWGGHTKCRVNRDTGRR